jgi:N-acetylneuraminic acid mutarotase
MRQVFVSHATEDLDTAQRVCKVLEADGISCWLATRDVEAGTDYAAAILDAIKNSRLVLLIFSGHANTSPYVLREIERAIAYERLVLSVRIDEAVPNPSMEYYLNLWQWLDTTGGVEKKRREIIAAVREQLDQVSSQGTSPKLADVAAPEPTDQSEPGPSKTAVTPRRRTRRRWMIAVAAALLILAAAGGGTWAATHSRAQDHNIWTKLSPAGELPSARNAQSMVYDPSSHRVIMFGGETFSYAPHFNDTWAYDPTANTWTELSPQGSLPPARYGQSLVYDPLTQRVIMFGGFASGKVMPNDTWAYDPSTNTWTNLSPAGEPPPARGFHSMVYDPSTQRMIVFGGGSDDSTLNDTWAYDPTANAWTRLSPVGGLPVARSGHSMVYDPNTQRVIMFGGSYGGKNGLNETWAYDPSINTWTNLNPPGTLPLGRLGQSMVYDPSAHRVIMFAGDSGTGRFGEGLDDNTLNDTWAYNPTANTWTNLNPSGGPRRSFQSMVYDPSTHRAIMFGGWNGQDSVNDTWAYTP